MGAAVAVPAIIQGASAIAGWWASRKAKQNAGKLTPAEQMFATPAGNSAQTLSNTGSSFLKSASGKLGQSGDYFSRILSGNRAEMATALLPETSRINEMYTGANRGTFNMRGPVRNRQMAENNRQRLSSLSQMIAGVRGQAAGNLGQMGLAEAGLGVGAQQGAGSIWSRLLNGRENSVTQANDEAGRTGEGAGSLIFNILRNTDWGKLGGGGGGGTASWSGVGGGNAASSTAINRAFGGVKF